MVDCRFVAEAFGGFALTLAAVSLVGLGGICERCGLGARAWRHVTPLVAMIGYMTVAAFISLVVLAERIAPNSWTLWQDGNSPNAADLLAQMALLGNCAFLWAVIGIMTEEQLGERRRWRRFVRDWAGGCLLVSVLAITLLLPASAALMVDATVSA